MVDLIPKLFLFSYFTNLNDSMQLFILKCSLAIQAILFSSLVYSYYNNKKKTKKSKLHCISRILFVLMWIIPLHFLVLKFKLNENIHNYLRNFDYFNKNIIINEIVINDFDFDPYYNYDPKIDVNNLIGSMEYTAIIPIHNEDEFIINSLNYIYNNSNLAYLKEIIIIDDASDIPVKKLLNDNLPNTIKKLIKLFRFNTQQGLIRGKIIGGLHAKYNTLAFLEGHVRPTNKWDVTLLEYLNNDLKNIVVPKIFDIDRYTWEDLNTFGVKMMFDWIFEFSWYDDDDIYIPISSGGIYMINKDWWTHIGMYDPGMKLWGGENIEQSIRVWLCGGSITNVAESRVGHIFSRDPKPNPNNSLVIQVNRNQKRVALVWLDSYFEYFKENHYNAMILEENYRIEDRRKLRKRLQCKDFSWFVDKFRNAFERNSLLLKEYKFFKLKNSDLCLKCVLGTKCQLVSCQINDQAQKFLVILNNRMIHNLDNHCISINKNNIEECQYDKVLSGENKNQFVSLINNRIVHLTTVSAIDVTGNNPLKLENSDNCAYDENNLCLSNLGFVPCNSVGVYEFDYTYLD